MIYNSILETIGRTPLVRLNRITQGLQVEIFAKIESFNPGGSVKDRVALAMIEEAERSGILKPGMTIIEPTSGNTGIGLAMVAAAKGYKLILTMPESMSIERRALLKAYGAELFLTPATEGMKGAIKKAQELAVIIPNSFCPAQFDNPANPTMHEKTTAREIIEDLQEKNVDYFVFGVGTGGTLTGVGRIIRSKNLPSKIIAVEPKDSPFLSEGKTGTHKIQGIGAGFKPSILDTNLIDEIITIENEEAISTARDLARKEGILVGISSGAALKACLKIANREENLSRKTTFVTIFPDTGERYLSTDLFNF